MAIVDKIDVEEIKKQTRELTLTSYKAGIQDARKLVNQILDELEKSCDKKMNEDV